MILGHAGMGSKSILRPNSIASIEKVKSLGAHGTELDIQISKDSFLICHHGKLKNEFISDLDLNEIRAINSKIASLNELTNLFLTHDFNFTLDIELNGNNINEIRNILMFKLKSYLESIQEMPISLEASDTSTLFKLIEFDFNFPIHFVTKDIHMIEEVIKNHKIDGISTHINLINKDFVKNLHDDSLLVSAWAVSTKKENNIAIKSNVDIIQSDKIRDLINKVNQIKNHYPFYE